MNKQLDPIAVCGMALRLPGGLKTPAQFWTFLTQKKDARARIPFERFDAEAFHSISGKSGYINSQYGYFLDESAEVGAIDNSLFRMSQQEAQRMDPQQKILLQLARECFESAGETDWHGKNFGTYIGSFGDDWAEMAMKDPLTKSPYKVTGYGDFMFANRISYEYDLKGPSMTIRTGCSASLIGLHEACVAVRSGDCSAALVGGCNLLWSPDMISDMAEQGVLSPNSSCRTFDAAADGYARGEAVNMIYIKPLSAAIKDGNPIRAIIRGSATNADGKTAGLSLPSSSSQEQMIRKAYQAAGILESEVTQTAFVECHGTSTPTGDPIETLAVGNVFGNSGVYIGSVKPNVGHSEGASGITSIIKAVLALEHRVIPPNIKFETPNPKIPFSEKDLRVPVDCIVWPEDKRERISVNSFGIGGANAHVILESAAGYALSRKNRSINTTRNGPSPVESGRLILMTANTPESLKTHVRDMHLYGLTNIESVGDISYTLACRRQHLTHRAFAVVQGMSVDSHPGISFTGACQSRLIMIFTGQGAQWPRMGIEMLWSNAAFASSIGAMDRELGTLPTPPCWSIQEELERCAASSQINEPAISQPLCTAIQVALVDALADLAIKPHSVLGHSSGEIAAAYAAGRISRRAAIIIAYYRGIASQTVLQSGAMAAIGLSWDEVAAYLPHGAVLACNNSPSSVTISGDEAAVQEAMNAIQTHNPGAFVRRLKVNTAYHSYHMLNIGGEYEGMMASVLEDEVSKFQGSFKSDFYSSVTGGLLPASERVDARYFRRNLESPVLFLQAVSSLIAHSKDASNSDSCLLELGPHRALSGPLQQILIQNSLNWPYASCLHREENSERTFLTALGRLWQHGVDLDLHRLTNPNNDAKVLTDMPLYPWHHDGVHMFHNRIAQAWRYPRFPHHELLGSLILENTESQPSFRNLLQLEHVPWLRDHNIHGDVVLPCAAYVTMAGEASRRLHTPDQGSEFLGFCVKNMVIGAAMILEENKPVEVITSMRRWRVTNDLESNGWDFTISSYSGIDWTKHCSGSVEAITSSPPSLSVTNDVFPRKTDAAKWYQAMWHVGARYGPFFQGLKDIGCTPKEQIAKAIACDNTPTDCESHYLVHPTTIDIFFQTTALAACNGKGHAIKRMNIPTFIKQMEVYDCSGDLQVHTSAQYLAHGKIHAGGHAIGPDGSLVMRLDTIKLTPLDATTEADAHAGALVTWDLEPSLTTMSALVKHDTKAATNGSILQEFTFLHIQKALGQVQDIEPASDTLRKFVSWMKRQSIPDTLRSLETVTSEVKNGPSSSIAHAIEKITDNIVKLIKEEISPLELLMADDSLTKIYQDAKSTDRAPYIKLLGHQKPNMKILEIGAGTGGTTREFLSALVNTSDGGKLWSSYTYTDISAGFFSTAKEKFKDFPALDFKVLDIAKDPITQGFQRHSYDLIIATNVIHAVPNLQEALRNVHALLQHDGTFYLEELCTDVKGINLTMGILPGWWLGEADGRLDEPYVQPERWDRELRNAGFAGVVDHMLDAPRPYQTHAYMISHPRVQDVIPKPITLLFDDSTEHAARVLEIELSQNGIFDTALQHWDTLAKLPKQDIICLLDVSKPFFMGIEAANFDKLRHVLVRISESRDGILWLTRSSQLSCDHPRWGQTPGAMRTIRKDVETDIAICEIDRLNDSSWKAVAQIAQKFSRRHLLGRDLELEYSVEHGRVYVPRIYPLDINSALCKQVTCTPITENTQLDLTIGTAGRLDTLQWAARPSVEPGDNQVVVEIMATGLNFRDVLIAMDLIELPNQEIGLEAAGVIRAVGSAVEDLKIGDRVIVMGGASLFTTEALVPSINCWTFPSSLSFQEAATMACVLLTCIYGLLEVGQMRNGQTVLVHSACGGVGLAAIQLCRMIGTTIYCTVSTEEKTKYLENEMGIPRHRIFDSRSRSFVADVMHATNGTGVDIVLNSLSGELLHASWECVAEFGKMIEIGKRDLLGNGRLSLNPFVENRSYHGVDLAHLCDSRPTERRRLLKRMIEFYEEGHIKPISPMKIFQMSEVEQCFRYMQQGRHMGKVVLSVGNTGGQPTDSPNLVTIHPKRKVAFNPEAGYLLAGGLGGLGRIVANWLVENGARHLIFLSRSAGERETDKAFFKELEIQGSKITAVKGNVANTRDVEKAVAAATAPVRGIMNLSMELQDMGFHHMTHAAWSAANDSKLNGTWNLHNVCLSRGITLDFFLLFSSISGLFGGPGQANYAAANTFLNSFAQFRNSLGLNASTIDIGLMYDHGYIAENPLILERTRLQGGFGIRIPQLLDAITLALITPATRSVDGTSRTCRSSMSIGVRSRTSLTDPSNRVMWKGDQRMAYYTNFDSSRASSASESGEDSPTRAIKYFINQVIAEPMILTQSDTATFLARQIAKKIAIMLLRPLGDEDDSKIDTSRSLLDVGLDSLVSIEMRSWWRTIFGTEITILQMLGAKNLIALGERATEGLKAKYTEIEAASVDPLGTSTITT
ncbi:hypothetical protein COCCADRAFT_110874 [Bipolaris zeicola 26-R-13]|uniref:Uncharacterized protein n=1 Tax=Cochliobolus carbonum (strain 26-R-13) TaxID=930089 RepID=W6Y9I9_COCC2|nr:uncharacterized protein COCCADRAFT_110874 [Bipolaris zeicola 26-R-13]EUC27751.1 hypothetical protein COCCADRAFT_110874 [Bipolaris zeicola 26-R-13]